MIDRMCAIRGGGGRGCQKVARTSIGRCGGGGNGWDKDDGMPDCRCVERENDITCKEGER